MHTSAVKKIAQTLKSVASKVEQPDSANQIHLRVHDNVKYSLPHEAAALYTNAIRAIIEFSDFSSKFSEK